MAPPHGPGDDCAVLPPSREATCVTTDALVDGVHFTRATFRPEDVGHKALAVNLSDLAAMGARPTWFVCALALPPDVDARYLDALARGMARLARESGILLVGGNFTRARELALTLTVAGALDGPALTRGGGRAGDLLYVSGALGGARQGLFDLAHGRRRTRAAARQLRPVPRLALGRLARRHARAGLDVSDGLAQDAGHLCAASGVGARLELARLPLERGVADPWDALRGGEDYELLLAVAPQRARAFEAACARAGERVTRVGALTRGRGLEVVDARGRVLPPPTGWDHFR